MTILYKMSDYHGLALYLWDIGLYNVSMAVLEQYIKDVKRNKYSVSDYYPCPRCELEMEYGGECYGCHYGYQPVSDRDAHQLFLESML